MRRIILYNDIWCGYLSSHDYVMEEYNHSPTFVPGAGLAGATCVSPNAHPQTQSAASRYQDAEYFSH